DGSSHGNPPERCPRPLYSRDSTQEGHTNPHHHQSGNLRDSKVEFKEEIKEEEDEDGGMEESEDTMVESSSYRNPPERCPHPLYSRDPIQEDHNYAQHDQVVNRLFSYWNPPERCPRPLYSRDSTQEGHTIPHHDWSGNLGDYNVVVKEEYKEEDSVMEELSEGHKDMMEPPNPRNPPERYPRPLYSWNSTKEGHTIPHHGKGEDLIDIKIEIKAEEEAYVRDDQQSVEEDGITGTFKEEDTPTEIST
ncbi:unnamed protein product, partial [Staurois parvus]